MKKLKIIIIVLYSYIIINLYIIQILNNNYYIDLLNNKTTKIEYGFSTPRGRIYDRNGVLLVDNKPMKIICYKKNGNTLNDKQIKKLSKHLNINSNSMDKNYLEEFYKSNSNSSNSLNLNELYLYYLINKGNSNEEKIIKDRDISNQEYAYIIEHTNEYRGFYVKLGWERDYKYDSIKTLIGKIGKINKENKSEYLNNGYLLNDIVGTSYIEKKYEKYLKGDKDKYKVINNSYKLIKLGSKGNDIYLTIDIRMQEETSKILKEEILNARNDLNAKYLDSSFEIITNPRTGEIITMNGQKLINDNFYEYSLGNINLSVTPGSSIKAASHIVGYNNGGLKIGEVRDDKCVKIKGTKEKCSIRYLGIVNDLTALKYSSNTYQFYTAMRVANFKYIYNGAFKINNNAYDLYRNTFKEFGLGTYSNIDLPNEKLGVRGNSDNSGHLLDLSIGQYDTYTPIQLSQYISTIANNGKRVRPYIISKILDRYGKTLYSSNVYIQSTVNTDDIYLQRIKDGLIMVLEEGGTGFNYISSNYNPAGKTGTSQTFIDTNNDGIVDTSTVSTQFVGYAPYNDPKITFTSITPNVYSYEKEGYVNSITKKITRKISDFYFNCIDKS